MTESPQFWQSLDQLVKLPEILLAFMGQDRQLMPDSKISIDAEIDCLEILTLLLNKDNRFGAYILTNFPSVLANASMYLLDGNDRLLRASTEFLLDLIKDLDENQKVALEGVHKVFENSI